jgi:Calcineurin-like phosphoesterase
MIRNLRSILTRPRAAMPARQTSENLPCPADPVYVVGDIHGRADLLERALDRIDTHVGRVDAANPQVVFVGDLIDRGPDGADVLARVWELAQELPDNVTCLMGNHERMLLDFLTDPVTRGPRWLRSGAHETLDSFGLHSSQLAPGGTPDLLRAGADALRRQMKPAMLGWLQGLPLSWSSGNLWVVHAAADPQHDMQDQSPRVLLWGHPEFESRPRNDGLWVVHGHTPSDYPVTDQGRIGIDTGAWTTGVLTTAAILPDGTVEFLYA